MTRFFSSLFNSLSSCSFNAYGTLRAFTNTSLVSPRGNITIMYNLPKDMASEDVLRHVQWPTFLMYYKLDILRLFYRAHSESLPDIMYENIGLKRVSAHFTRDHNRLLVPSIEHMLCSQESSFTFLPRVLVCFLVEFDLPLCFLVYLCSRTRSPMLSEVNRGNSCI